jgi:hypothetical protein
VLAMVIVVVAGPPARGQDEPDADNAVDAAARPPDREQLMQFQRQRLQLAHKRNLENWIATTFGHSGGVKDHLDSALAHRLDDLWITCQLTEAQRTKLQLAGRGDIKRSQDRLAATLKKWTEAPTSDPQTLALETRDLQEDLERPFGAGSLFGKTLVTTLSRDQMVQNENGLRDKNSVHYREAVLQTVRRLARLINLSTGQRDELAKLILSETTPPLSFGQSDYAFVMFQASRMPAARLRAIVDEKQWKTLSRQLDSWGDSEQNLRDEGFIFTARPKAAGPVVKEPAVDKAKGQARKAL